jgi:hypothetical protein
MHFQSHDLETEEYFLDLEKCADYLHFIFSFYGLFTF